MENLLEITEHGPLVLVIFLIGYALIILENLIKFNKAATALIMAIGCWTVLFFEPAESVDRHIYLFTFQMFKVSQVLFFLLGALTIVELINVHKGFVVITRHLAIASKKAMLWSAGLVTFFLSAVLDNLTTTIVMVSLIGKLVQNREERLLFGGMVVIAANAGGAWTPIGDVATTLLWINGQVTTVPTIRDLFLPSLLGFMTALFWFGTRLKGHFDVSQFQEERPEPHATLVLVLGMCSLIFVPIFKILTDLPPFMGMMLGLGVLWITTDLLHYRYKERDHLRVSSILPKVDVTIILFYLGVLLAINSLETAGLLRNMAKWLDSTVHTPLMIPLVIGLFSSVVDNVSLVAATIAMYDLTFFKSDSPFWQAIAYCAGTGGSILIIGSAAGVAFMSIEKVDFMWYLRRITLPALLVFFTGIALYFLLKL